MDKNYDKSRTLVERLREIEVMKIAIILSFTAGIIGNLLVTSLFRYIDQKEFSGFHLIISILFTFLLFFILERLIKIYLKEVDNKTIKIEGNNE